MFSKKITSALAAAVIAIGGMSTAYAQPSGCSFISLPNGLILTCTVNSNGQKVYVDNLGNAYTGSSNGTGDFQIINTNSSPCSALLNPVNINVTSTAGALGTINVKLDGTRISTTSQIVSNGPFSTFPATEDVYFYATATVSSLPGKNFRSIQQLHLFSNNVKTFAPHVFEPFTLVSQVDFEDITAPGIIVFSLQSLTVTL